MSKSLSLSQAIKTKAKALGFTSVGIAKADALNKERSALREWLDKGYHGKMGYMANHFEKRLDPRQLLEGAQSIIVVSHSYYPKQALPDNTYKVARYAYGEDYHTVLKDKLKVLHAFIEQKAGGVKARVFTDSAPVMERSWASRAGLGWQGKHSLLIQKGLGSYFFIAEMIVDIALDYDQPFVTNHCGTCTRCIDACPTKAILPNGTINGSKCISYLTIELKDDIPKSFKNQWSDWIFGCDICQEACPWNASPIPHSESRFDPPPELLTMTKQDWQSLTAERFNTLFKQSAIKRAKYSGIKKSIDFLESQ